MPSFARFRTILVQRRETFAMLSFFLTRYMWARALLVPCIYESVPSNRSFIAILASGSSASFCSDNLPAQLR